jgi:elongation factor G
MIKKRLGARPLVAHLPIGSEDNFKGMVDLVENKAYTWDSDDRDATWEIHELTGNLADKFGITVPSDRAILDSVPKYRTELVDTALEQDDVGDADLRQMIGDRPAGHSAADDDHVGMTGEGHRLSA